MPRPKSALPGYCHHKASGQAYVTLNGSEVYLGDHGTPESRAAYDRVVGEWLARGRTSPQAPPAGQAGPVAGRKVSVLIDRFWEHAQTYYRKPDGTPTSELDGLRLALRFLNRVHGDTPIDDFGPLALKALREMMIRPAVYEHPGTGEPTRHKGWSRTFTNHQVSRIKMVFKWGVENELVPAPVYQALAAVAGLRRGRTEARETEPVKPVAEETVLKVLPHLPAAVAAIVELEMYSGARGGELCAMKGRELDRSGVVWVYRPAGHKTAHHGKVREIRFGPKAQKVLSAFLKDDPDAFVFSPAESEAKRRTEVHRRRVETKSTPLSCGNVPGSNRSARPKRPPGDRYTKGSYLKAIDRACELAFPPPAHLARGRVRFPGKEKQSRRETAAEWKARLGSEKWAQLQAWRKANRFHPHQLRHTTATKVRKVYGLEAASVVLGHSNTKMTELYAEADAELAEKVMGELG